MPRATGNKQNMHYYAHYGKPKILPYLANPQIFTAYFVPYFLRSFFRQSTPPSPKPATCHPFSKRFLSPPLKFHFVIHVAIMVIYIKKNIFLILKNFTSLYIVVKTLPCLPCLPYKINYAHKCTQNIVHTHRIHILVLALSAHNPLVVGSNPTSPTKVFPELVLIYQLLE